MAASKPSRILIVDNEALLVMSLRLLLEATDDFVVTGSAACVAEALRAAEEVPPDLALVDLRLANGEDGLEVARRLGERRIPCLLMSGNPPQQVYGEIAVGCISKPFGDADMRASIAIALTRAAGGDVPPRVPGCLHLY